MNHALGANIQLRSADDIFKDPSSIRRPNVFIDALSHCDAYYREALLPFIANQQPDTVVLRYPVTISMKTESNAVYTKLDELGYSLATQALNSCLYGNHTELTSQFLICTHPGAPALHIPMSARVALPSLESVLDPINAIEESLWIPEAAINPLPKRRAAVDSNAIIVARAGAQHTPVYDAHASSTLSGRSSLYCTLISDARNGRGLTTSVRQLSTDEIARVLGYDSVDNCFEPLIESSVPSSLYTVIFDSALSHAVNSFRCYLPNDPALLTCSNAFTTSHDLTAYAEDIAYAPQLTS